LINQKVREALKNKRKSIKMKKQALLLIFTLLLFAGKALGQCPSIGGTATATLSTVCSGTGTTITLTGYHGLIQWQSKTTGSFADISGQTSTTLNTGNLTQTTYFRATVTEPTCSADLSTEAMVTVNPVSAGGTATATLTSICSGTGTTITLTSYTGTIQWQSKTTGTYANLSGETSATLSTGNLIATTHYQAVVTSGVCSSATSSEATVTVNTSVGGTATATLSTVCTGTGTTIALTGYTGTIQWQSKTTGSYADISGETSASLSTGNLTATTHYQAVVTNGSCSPSTSTEATVTVSPVSSGGTATATLTSICSGTGTTITLTSYTGTIQWQSKTTGSYANISGETSATLSTGNLTATTSYQAVVTSGACSSATSSEAIVTVNTSVGGTATATLSTICTGAGTTVTLTSYTGTIQWQSKTTGAYADISGETSATLSTGSLTATTHFQAVVTNGSCSSSTSSEATVTVSPASAGGTATATLSSICSGTGTTITLTSYTGTIQWQSKTTGSYADISGETSATLNTGNLTTTTHYQAVVISGACSSATSSEATVTVNTSVGGTATSTLTTVCTGTGTTITLTSYTGTIQWQSKTTGSYADISGETSATLSTGSLTVTTYYQAVVTNGTCSSATSTEASVTVNPVSFGGTASADQTICSGFSPADLTLGGGYVGTIQRWEKSTDNFSSSIIPIAETSATLSSATMGTLTADTWYRAVVKNGPCSESNSSVVKITINALPVVSFSIQPGTSATCSETDVTYTTQSGSGESNYLWGGFGTADVDYSITSGGLSSTDNTVTLKWLTSGNKTVTINYTNSNSCTATSPTASLTTPVNPVPVDPVFSAGSLNVCYNSADETYTAVSVGSTISYSVSPSGTGAGKPGTINSSTGVMSWKNDFSGTVTITALASNSCANKSVAEVVTVNPTTLATPASITGNTTVCEGETSVSYSISAIPYAQDYIWTLPTGATYVSGSGTTAVVLNFSAVSAGSHSLSVKAHNHCVTGSNQTITVTVKSAPSADISGSTTACQNESKNITFTNNMSAAITVTYNINGGDPQTKNINASTTATIAAQTATPGSYDYNLVSAVYQTGASCPNTFSGKKVTMVVTATVGTPTAITVSAGTEPTCQITGSPTTTYATTATDNLGFNWSRSNAAAGSINATTGVMTWTNGFSGNVDIRVTANGCNGPSSQVIRTVSVIGNPTTPVPSASTICQGSTNTTYTTSATNATTYTWSVSGSGNSISQGSATGSVTWDPTFSGSSTIQVFADGCPSATSSTNVTVRPTPSPSISGTTAVCKNGTQPVITLTNNQNAIATVTITYSINGVNQTPIDVATTSTVNAPTGTVGTFNYSLVSAVYKTGATCSSIASGSAVVTVNPLPVPTISGPAVQRVTSTGNTYTTEAGMTSYNWTVSAGGAITSGSGTNSITVTWSTSGSKTVSVNYTNGTSCTAASPTVYNVQVNPLPSATSVSIPSSADEGTPITGSYTYNDNGGYSEGTSTYKWYRGGSTVVATTRTYTPVTADVGFTLTFEVTPVSTSPTPNSGSPVASSPTSAVISSGFPVASEVCIQGKRAENEILTGKYKYSYPFAESGTTFRWLRGADSTSTTTLGTGITYQITSADMSSGKDIYFEVTPKCASPAKAGQPVKSTRLARITLAQDHYTDLVDTVKLTVIPAGGAFSGAGVTNGIFSPKSVGASATPYKVNYLYTETNTTTTCSQQEIKDIYVSASTTQFSTVKDPICKDDAPFWVTVNAIPTGAIPYIYQYYYTSYGYGYDFGFFVNDYFYYGATNTTNKGILAEDLSPLPYQPNPALPGYTPPWRVQIDPNQLNVGAGANILYLYYQDTYGYYYLIQMPLNVEEVGAVSEISNLNPAYCSEDAKQQITVYGLYPAGGSATWTGNLITPATDGDLIAELDPSRGVPGNTYPISYKYKTLNGCYSNILTKNVTINPVPNANFTVAPYNNIEGGPVNLVPAVPPPTGVGATATFIGAGVSANKFYPAIAGVGSFNIEYKVKTAEGCTNNKTNTAEVDKPTGTFNNLPSKICYSNTTYNVSMSDLPSDLDGYTVLNFKNKKNSLVWTSGSLSAQYNVAAARAGYDTLMFSYRRKGIDFTLSKGVFIDSIGNIQITGLKDNYCDYDGTATLRVLVENSTGSGNFSFSGPGVAFTNYGLLADFYPSNAPTATPYTVSYTHVSTVNNSGCTKTESLPVTVNKSPYVNIFNTRTTVNIKETPLVLSGSPVDGIFSGKGVYKSGSSYVFDPVVAGLGDIEFALSYTNSKGCLATKKDTLTVAEASGSIDGINANNQYCYDGPKDQLTYTSSKPWTAGSFSGQGITNIASAQAEFDPASAGKGDHDIVFTYSDLFGTVFNISATVNVDSLGKVAIQNLLPGDKYCNNATPFELFTTPKGGVFTGPVVSGSLNPSKAIGDTAVTYTYLNVKTGCSITGRVPFRINPAPSVSFVASDNCIENSTDSIRFINNSVSSDNIKDWLWSFSDASGTGLSSIKSPAYIFKTGGQHLVTLTATTINSCSVKLDQTIDLGVKPVADFYWKNECYHPNESLQLFDTTFSTSAVASRTWNFFDGGPLLSGTNPTYPKKAAGYQKVQYIVNTYYANCADTVTKNIYIRPSVALASDSYFQDFETGNGGWVQYEDNGNSWSFGKPDRTVINNAYSGTKAWYTNYALLNQKVESSSIVSPCFDFTSTDRPMISLELWRQFDKDRDGAALQYKVKDEKNWHYVGTLDDGIKWYNSAVIKGKPGGEPLGWTTKDSKWIESRHTLDELKNQKDVKFRIAYGSDGTATNNDGIAFDNIWIGERSRKVLLEHFANTSSLPSKDATSIVNSVVSKKTGDVINIQYHTNFPGADPFYNENPGDASARILFYGLTKVPYSFIDGGNIDSLYAKVYDYKLASLDSNDVTRRSLINPKFIISLDSAVSGGILTVSGKITALDVVNSDNLTLYVAVTERINTNHTGANGETTFNNVFRKFVPDAGGISLNKNWLKGESFILPKKTWVIEKTLNLADIVVIAFIQNNVTKEVYQASSQTNSNIVVGIEKLTNGKEDNFALYPNPANNRLTISFEKTLVRGADISIYDVQGTIIKSYKAGSGITEYTIESLGLKSGIYLIRVSKDGVNLGFKKLIVSGD
jgi:hypothetical protein